MKTHLQIATEESFNMCLNNLKEKRKAFFKAEDATYHHGHGYGDYEKKKASDELNSAALSLSYAILSCEDNKVNINFVGEK